MDDIAQAIENAIGEGASGSELACAKINLALHVTGRRTDGYHQIDTLVVFADYADVVNARPSTDGRMRLTVKGPLAARLADTQPGENLAIRAANELMRATSGRQGKLPPTKLVLTKRIPVAAGLGGGSADAAAALRLLNREWRLNVSDEALARIALRLGADVPMCLMSQPLVAKGIGERITPVSGMPAMPIVLAAPDTALKTASVFAKLEVEERSPLPRLPKKFASLLEVIFWLRQARNDLAEPAALVSKSAASAAKVLMRDPDCLFARMSGSGPAAFGIFASMGAAERAAERIRDAKPSWWVTAAMTLAS